MKQLRIDEHVITFVNDEHEVEALSDRELIEHLLMSDEVAPGIQALARSVLSLLTESDKTNGAVD